jgi:hypothetical protein
MKRSLSRTSIPCPGLSQSHDESISASTRSVHSQSLRTWGLTLVPAALRHSSRNQSVARARVVLRPLEGMSAWRTMTAASGIAGAFFDFYATRACQWDWQ